MAGGREHPTLDEPPDFLGKRDFLGKAVEPHRQRLFAVVVSRPALID